MKQSFEQCGFTDGCEFLLYDNSVKNEVDAYQALSGFMKLAKGRYLLAVHQDVRCIDSRKQLLECLEALTALDEKWAVCGNAGANGYHEQWKYINNAGTVVINDGLPAKVRSLDENLLIINRNTNITISGDLTGFHLYGTDLCLIADMLGYTSYVIPFMVKHLSLGNFTGFDKHVQLFATVYGEKLRSRYIETTCTKFYLSNSATKNKLYNLPLSLSLIKAGQRVKQLLKLLSGESKHAKHVRKES